MNGQSKERGNLRRGRKVFATGSQPAPRPFGFSQVGGENSHNQSVPRAFQHDPEADVSHNATMELMQKDWDRNKKAQANAQRRKPELDKTAPSAFKPNKRSSNASDVNSDVDEPTPPLKSAGKRRRSGRHTVAAAQHFEAEESGNSARSTTDNNSASVKSKEKRQKSRQLQNESDRDSTPQQLVHSSDVDVEAEEESDHFPPEMQNGSKAARHSHGSSIRSTADNNSAAVGNRGKSQESRRLQNESSRDSTPQQLVHSSDIDVEAEEESDHFPPEIHNGSKAARYSHGASMRREPVTVFEQLSHNNSKISADANFVASNEEIVQSNSPAMANSSTHGSVVESQQQPAVGRSFMLWLSDSVSKAKKTPSASAAAVNQRINETVSKAKKTSNAAATVNKTVNTADNSGAIQSQPIVNPKGNNRGSIVDNLPKTDKVKFGQQRKALDFGGHSSSDDSPVQSGGRRKNVAKPQILAESDDDNAGSEQSDSTGENDMAIPPGSEPLKRQTKPVEEEESIVNNMSALMGDHQYSRSSRVLDDAIHTSTAEKEKRNRSQTVNNTSRRSRSSKKSAKKKQVSNNVYSSDEDLLQMANSSERLRAAESVEQSAVVDIPEQPVVLQPPFQRPPLPISAAKASLLRRNIIPNPMMGDAQLMQKFLASTSAHAPVHTSNPTSTPVSSGPSHTGEGSFFPDVSQIGPPRNHKVNTPTTSKTPVQVRLQEQQAKSNSDSDWLTEEVRVELPMALVHKQNAAAPVIKPNIIILPNEPVNGGTHRRSGSAKRRIDNYESDSSPPSKRRSPDKPSNNPADEYEFNANESDEIPPQVAKSAKKNKSRAESVGKSGKTKSTKKNLTKSVERSAVQSPVQDGDVEIEEDLGMGSSEDQPDEPVVTQPPTDADNSSNQENHSKTSKRSHKKKAERRRSVVFTENEPIVHEPAAMGESLFSTESTDLFDGINRTIANQSRGSNTTGYASGDSIKHYYNCTGDVSSAAGSDSTGPMFGSVPPPERIMPSEATPGCRRSQRPRMPRLRHWLGERAVYEEYPDGPKFVRIEPMHVDKYVAKFGLTDLVDPVEMRKRKKQLKADLKRKGKVPKKQPKPPKELSIHVADAEELLNRSDLKNFEEPIEVKNAESGGTSSVACFTRVTDDRFLNTNRHPAALNDAHGIANIFTDAGVKAGEMLIRPLSSYNGKSRLQSFITFYVISGSLLVTINDVSKQVATGVHFYVPSGNSYFMKNLRREDAKLSFLVVPKPSDCNP